MDQDQPEHKHVCRFCNKSFSNGKVLGGHMRCHVAKNPKKLAKKRTEKSNIVITDNDNNNKSYSLRVNPKKSTRISPVPIAEEASPSREIHCRVCGKVFDTARALFGHMRHHSTTTNKPKKEPFTRQPITGEEEGLIRETIFVETSGFAKRKRSRRPWYKVSTTNTTSTSTGLTDCSGSNSSLLGGFDLEVEEIALSLLMLSSGVRVGSDELRSAKKPRLDEDDSGLGADFLDDKKPSQLSESDHLEQDCGSFKCKICDKSFHSHQALGGHQTIHRPTKADNFSAVNDEFVDFVGERASVVVTSSEAKEHKCHLCFKVFASGQALGGHKRAHMVRDSSEVEADQIPLRDSSEVEADQIPLRDSSEVEADQIPVVNHHEIYGISGHGIDCDVELKSPWWVMNNHNHKHELLVGLVPN